MSRRVKREHVKDDANVAVLRRFLAACPLISGDPNSLRAVPHCVLVGTLAAYDALHARITVAEGEPEHVAKIRPHPRVPEHGGGMMGRQYLAPMPLSEALAHWDTHATKPNSTTRRALEVIVKCAREENARQQREAAEDDRVERGMLSSLCECCEAEIPESSDYGADEDGCYCCATCKAELLAADADATAEGQDDA